LVRADEVQRLDEVNRRRVSASIVVAVIRDVIRGLDRLVSTDLPAAAKAANLRAYEDGKALVDS